MKITSKLILVVLCLSANWAVLAKVDQTPTNVLASAIIKQAKTDIQSAFEKLRLEQNIPGMEASLSFDAPDLNAPKTLNFVLGVSQYNTKDALAGDHIWPVASVTKMFTSVAIMQLVEQGILDLESPLSSYQKVPLVRKALTFKPELSEWLFHTNINHLLSHQSGLMQDLPGANMWWDVDAIQNGSLPSISEFETALPLIQPLFEAGKISLGMKYSNLGFNFLAQIVANYGKHNSFEQYVANEILKPLQMDNTTFYPFSSRLPMITTHGSLDIDKSGDGDRQILPNIIDSGSYAGSIGLYSTSKDLLKFAQFLEKILNDKSNVESLGIGRNIWKAIYPVSPQTSTTAWGYGFHLTSINGTIAIGHTGSHFGARSIVYYLPEFGFTFSALFNSRDGVNREAYLNKAMTILKDLNLISQKKMQQRLSLAVEDIKSAHASIKSVTSFPLAFLSWNQVPPELKEYVGIYESKIAGRFEVKVSASGKLVYLGKELIFVSTDHYKFSETTSPYDSGEPVRFLRDPTTGKVNRINSHYVLHLHRIEDVR